MTPRKVAVLTGLASLGISLITVVSGPLVAEAGLQASTCSFAAISGAAHENVCHLSTAAYLNAPTLHQDLPLDCESAALAVALQTKGSPCRRCGCSTRFPSNRKPRWFPGSGR